MECIEIHCHYIELEVSLFCNFKLRDLFLKTVYAYNRNVSNDSRRQKGGNMLNCIAVGKKIQEYRVKHQYSQEQLAELLYVSRQAVSRWELGQAVPTIDNMITLSRLFSVSFEELLCLNEERILDPQNIFRGHDRNYIVRRVCDGDLQVNLPEVFWQFSPEERMQVLSSIKRKGDRIDEELFVRLSTAEQAFMREHLNFIRKSENYVFITER